MNFARQAIRFEMSRSSAAVLLRLYLRLQLLWFMVWAASNLFLVWYWSGRISGPGAHQYFGRWFLAWLFTQKLPLYFLSLPYHGQRCTIGSIYAFLNWRPLNIGQCSLLRAEFEPNRPRCDPKMWR